MRLTLVLVNEKAVTRIVLRQIIAISLIKVGNSQRSPTIILSVAEPQNATMKRGASNFLYDNFNQFDMPDDPAIATNTI